MGSCATALIVIATIFGPVTLTFMGVSFGTDHWLEFDVDRSLIPADELPAVNDVEKNRYYTSRDRGIFRECYPDNNTAWLDAADNVVDGNCFNINYEMPSSSEDPSYYFKTRLHLNRCFLAFFILALALFVFSFIIGLILCCLRTSRYAYIAGLFAYGAAFSLAAAIAFFHGAEYIERNKLNDPVSEAEFYPNWSSALKNATDRDYGWSYALGWVGMILAALTATFYSLAGCYLTSERYEEREALEKRGMVRDYPIAMEPVYAVGADPYYTKHYGYPQAYLGPMAPEYYARPAYPTLEHGKDQWRWREIES